ncbi:MAG: glycosyltransferase [Bacteroidales bacterium]|nr:glycosyltransferase [Bacteroidales bacterium]
MKKWNFKHIGLLSTHGYFDPVPQLGRTDTGGQVVYVLELAKAIARHGIKVDIITRWFEKEKEPYDPVPGHPAVHVVRIPCGPWEFIPKEFIYDVLPALRDNFLDYIRKNQIDYDLFHGHYVDAGIVAIETAKELGKPSFFTAHSLGAWKRDQMGGDPDEMEKNFNFGLRIAEELRIFRTVNAQSLTSVLQKEKLNTLYPFDADNIEIIPPGVDVHRYTLPGPGYKKVKTDLHEDYIFCLSRIDTNKGHDLLLEAFADVAGQNKTVSLVIAGGSPEPKPRETEVFNMIRKIIAQKKLEGRVQLIGYVPDDLMATYYRQCLFFVLPSIFEPFGMTSQEAMACGKTVVASRFGGIRNVITHGVNGLLVDVRNKNEFTGAMLQMINDPEKRETIGLNANKNILENFSWEAIAGRFLDFYSKYLERR